MLHDVSNVVICVSCWLLCPMHPAVSNDNVWWLGYRLAVAMLCLMLPAVSNADGCVYCGLLCLILPAVSNVVCCVLCTLMCLMLLMGGRLSPRRCPAVSNAACCV